MEKNTKIIIGITLAILVNLGINISNLQNDNYYCSDRNITYHCDGFSQYYGIYNGKCINENGPNKLCTSGWETIFRDVEEDKKIDNVYYGNSVRRRATCDQIQCKEVKNG
jgi:hypothetical protein